MTFVFDGWSVTTWQRVGDTWEWRARLGEEIAYFLADRDADVAELIDKGGRALGLERSVQRDLDSITTTP